MSTPTSRSATVEFSATYVTSEVYEQETTTTSHKNTGATTTTKATNNDDRNERILFSNWVRYESQLDEEEEDPLRRFCIISTTSLRLYFDEEAATLLLYEANGGVHHPHGIASSNNRLKKLRSTQNSMLNRSTASHDSATAGDTNSSTEQQPNTRPVLRAPLREISVCEEQPTSGPGDLRAFLCVSSQNLIFHCADFEVYDQFMEALRYIEHRLVTVGVNTGPDARLDAAENDLSMLEDDMAQLENELDEAKRHSAVAECELFLSKIKCKEADERWKLLHDKDRQFHAGAMKILTKELEETKNEAKALQEQLQEERLSANETHVAEVQKLRDELALRDAQLATRDHTIAELEDEKATFKKKFAKSSAENDLLLAENGELKQNLETVEKDRHADTTRLEQALAALAAESANLKELHAAKEAKFASEKTKLLDELRQLNKELRGEQAQRKAERAERHEEVLNLRKEVDTLQHKLDVSVRRVRQLEEDAGCERAKIAQLLQDVDDLRHQTQRFKQEAQKFKEFPRKWLFSLPTPEEFARIGVCLKRAAKVTQHIRGCEQMCREFDNFVPTMTKMVKLYDDFILQLDAMDG